MMITLDPVIFAQNFFTNLDLHTYHLLKISFNKNEDSFAVY
jgi:hypothetical protein